MAFVDYLNSIAQLAGLFMLILSITWFIYAAYEANRRETWRQLTKIEDWDFKITMFLRIFTFFGFIIGLCSIAVGVLGLLLNVPPSIAYSVKTGETVNVFTSVFLIVFGIFTFMKPLNDLPIDSIAGFAVATIVNVIIVGVIMYLGITISTAIAIGLIILFLVIFAIVAITVKFYTAGLMAISKFISWPPLAFLFALFCFIQGILLLVFGISIM